MFSQRHEGSIHPLSLLKKANAIKRFGNGFNRDADDGADLLEGNRFQGRFLRACNRLIRYVENCWAPSAAWFASLSDERIKIARRLQSGGEVLRGRGEFPRRRRTKVSREKEE